jgi:hypothetical protein
VPTIPLPSDPSLENLKKRAKALLGAVRAGDAAALATVREHHPRGDAAARDFKLSDAQRVVAQSHGFPSWARLKQHLAVVDRHAWDPRSARDGEPKADVLVRLSCMDYEGWTPARAERARAMLAAVPELAAANIYTAATVGDVTAARALLAADPELADRKGGPLGWKPLLYACYSRLDSPEPRHSTLDVARLLLDSGADPNAGFLWRGNVPPCTALTGVFGEGENGNNEPPHRDRDELARLLLDAGADPNDGQTLYNRHFRRPNDHLELLFAYGTASTSMRETAPAGPRSIAPSPRSASSASRCCAGSARRPRASFEVGPERKARMPDSALTAVVDDRIWTLDSWCLSASSSAPAPAPAPVLVPVPGANRHVRRPLVTEGRIGGGNEYGKGSGSDRIGSDQRLSSSRRWPDEASAGHGWPTSA